MLFQIWWMLLIGVILLPGTKVVVEAINDNLFHRLPTVAEVVLAWLSVMLLFLLAMLA